MKNRTKSDIKKRDLFSEYAGVIQPSNEVKDRSWSWRYPSEIYKDELGIPAISIDSKFAGNSMRFVNDGKDINTEMRNIFLDGYVRTLYVATKDIDRDQQILISYGPAYWQRRKKAGM